MLAKVLVVAALVIMGVLVVDDDLEDDDVGDDHRDHVALGAPGSPSARSATGPGRNRTHLAHTAPGGKLMPNGTSRRLRRPERGQRRGGGDKVLRRAKTGHQQSCPTGRALGLLPAPQIVTVGPQPR